VEWRNGGIQKKRDERTRDEREQTWVRNKEREEA